MLFGPKKYIYLSVCFQNSRHPYAYLTTDKSIKINDVVMVPVPDGEAKPAIVAGVTVCTEKEAPWPPAQTKMILGRADRKNRKLFAGVDMRIPMDISVVRITNKKGKIEEHITTAKERELLRKEYAKSPNVKIIETRKPAPDTDWIDEIEFFDAIFDDR